MSYTIAIIFDEDDAQAMNSGLTDDQKDAFTNPGMTEFYCTQEVAERVFGVEEFGNKYDLIDISTGQYDSTFPLPKRRKIPV